jgi:hypothetical protein
MWHGWLAPGGKRTTLEIYTHVDEPAQRDALNRLQGLLGERQG